MRALRVAFALCGCALVSAGCGRSGGGASPPGPAGLGSPRAPAHLLSVDAAGGQLAVTDLAGTATITVTVPPGALASATDVTVTEITNSAPGGVGSAWRIGPEGVQLAAPVTLTFTPGVPVDGLGVSTQASGGYWLRRRDVVRDGAGGTVAVSTDHFSDWSVTTGSSARDLQGLVTLTQTGTIDVPATVSGALTLDYVGDIGDTSYYVLGGTLNAPATLVDGAATCTPTQLAFPVRANIAELRLSPARFRWGTSGAWPLTCEGAGSFSSTLLVAFDDMGLGYPGCARSDLTPPIATADQVQGQYLIDCGAHGQVTATWRFVSCQAGVSCAPSTPCRTGAISCAAALPTCVETGNAADGSACGTQPADACQGGSCVTCSPNASCTPVDPCRTGTVSCDTSPASCVASGDMPDGTHCGTQAADQCVGGACAVCQPGASCGAPTECQTAALVCSTSPATCDLQSKPDGTACGTQPGDQCVGGACAVCQPGAPCGAPTECQTASTDCGTAPATCTLADLPNGTPCSLGTCTGGVCGP